MITIENANEAGAASGAELYGDILEDIRDMLDFLRADGKAVPEELRAKVTELWAGVTEKGAQAESPFKAAAAVAVGEAVPAGVEAAPARAEALPAKAAATPPMFSLALEIHGALSQLVTPATPRTIRASRSTGRVKFIADNATVKFLLFASMISLVVFLIIAAWTTAKVALQESGKPGASGSNAPVAILTNAATESAAMAPKSNPPVSTTPLKPKDAKPGDRRENATATENPPVEITIRDILMVFAAASLGSAFYGLYTAHKYLVSCTFDPKYHQVYFIRYVLGLTSGTILGFFGKDLNFMQGDSRQLGMAVLALVGGYAAEAVSQILQRFAETLVTVVRGSNADVLDAKQEELKAKAKQQEAQTKAALVQPLQKAKEAAMVASPRNPAVEQEIQKAIDSLSK